MEDNADVAYWLRRAPISEMVRERDREAAKPQLAIRFRLLSAIDEELFRRSVVLGEEFKD